MPHHVRPALLLACGIASLVALGATAGPAAASDGDHSGRSERGSAVRSAAGAHTVDRSLNDRAAGAGLSRSGGGQMGWTAPDGPTGSAQSPSTTRPQATSKAAATQVPGIDVSRYQGSVDWASYYSQGKRFAYVKATEGSSYTSPTFSAQYSGAAKAGMVRGAYHFANPSGASGATQAQYFVSHGGGWSNDGKTLPGVLDIEYNPYSGGTCYGLSAASMRSWISSFTTKYKALTGRDAVIYSTTDWWKTCTGNTSAFSTTNPLWIARYSSSVGTLPAGWGYYTFWQYSSSPIDQDRFNGSITQLKKLATG